MIVLSAVLPCSQILEYYMTVVSSLDCLLKHTVLFNYYNIVLFFFYYFVSRRLMAVLFQTVEITTTLMAEEAAEVY